MEIPRRKYIISTTRRKFENYGQYPCFLHRVQTGSGVNKTLIQGATGVLTMQIKRPKLEANH
jgi:hypothetical protein